VQGDYRMAQICLKDREVYLPLREPLVDDPHNVRASAFKPLELSE
jgi:hypothetical protein